MEAGVKGVSTDKPVAAKLSDAEVNEIVAWGEPLAVLIRVVGTLMVGSPHLTVMQMVLTDS